MPVMLPTDRDRHDYWAYRRTEPRVVAEEIFDRFGTILNPDWKANVVERKKKLSSPKIKAFVFPRLEPVTKNGAVVDATIHSDEDLTEQQLRFAAIESSVAINVDRKSSTPVTA